MGAVGLAHADSLSCGDRLVPTGSSPYDVQSRCGPPDAVEQRTETRTVRRAIRVPCAVGYCTTYVDDSIEVPIEQWTYDFGKQRFLQYLTFEAGQLIRIKSGSYGYKD
jgi:hypothetical protein